MWLKLKGVLYPALLELYNVKLSSMSRNRFAWTEFAAKNLNIFLNGNLFPILKITKQNWTSTETKKMKNHINR